MRLLVKTLQAILIVLALMMMIFLVLDGFNPTMNFLRNGITKGLLWAFSLLALGDGLLVMGCVIILAFFVMEQSFLAVLTATV